MSDGLEDQLHAVEEGDIATVTYLPTGETSKNSFTGEVVLVHPGGDTVPPGVTVKLESGAFRTVCGNARLTNAKGPDAPNGRVIGFAHSVQRVETDGGEVDERPVHALDQHEAERRVAEDDLLHDPEALTYTKFPEPERTSITIDSVDLEHDGRSLVVRLHLADDSTCSIRGLRQHGKRGRGDDHLDMLASYYDDVIPDQSGFEGLIYIAGEELPVVSDSRTDTAWDRIDVGTLTHNIAPHTHDVEVECGECGKTLYVDEEPGYAVQCETCAEKGIEESVAEERDPR